MKCPGCGATNPLGSSQCDYCDKPFTSEPPPTPVAKQNISNVAIPADQGRDEQQPTSLTSQRNYDGLSKWYQDVFTKFDNDPATGLKMKFSWPPFLFGPFWYLSKGLWAKALIYIAVALVSGGTLAIFAWIYTSIFGIYDYYLLKKFDKQLW
jgi:hypothetical protein